MTVVFPDGVLTAGRERVLWVPTIANMAAPTTTELNAGSAVDIACYLIKGQWNPTADQATGTDERVCSAQAGTVLGATTYSIENAQYVYDPQGTIGQADNKAYDALKEGTTGFIVDRRGPLSDAVWAVGQKVDVFQVECGVQVRIPISTDAGDKFKIQQTLAVSPNVVQDALVA